MFKLDLEKAEEPEIKLPMSIGWYWIQLDRKSKRVPEKHLILLYWPYQSLWLCEWRNVKLLSRVQLFETPMDCTLPGSSIHGIFQARVLERVAISFSRGSSQPKDWTWVSCIANRCFTIWVTREPWWLYGSQQIMENSLRDVNTRPPELPPEKPVCRSRSNS